MSSSVRATEIARQILHATDPLRQSDLSARLHLHEPFKLSDATEYLKEAVDSGFVSSAGPMVDRFAASLAESSGVRHAIPVVNGTSALQLALYLEGVRANDDVLVPAMSFIATANAVTFLGARPVFVDSDPLESGSSLRISSSSLRQLLEEEYEHRDSGPHSRQTGRRLGALVVVHTLGRYDSLSEVRAIASEFKIPVVEDAAAALGSRFGSDLPGKQSTAILSFNGNKIITTGGGGAILTNSNEVALNASELSTTAKVPHPWRFSHKSVGWNFRLPSLNAALGLSQLSLLPEILRRKELLQSHYRESFASSAELQFLENPSNSKQNNWLIPVAIRDATPGLITEVLDHVHAQGVLCRPMWDLIPEQEPYRSKRISSFPNAKNYRNSIICLPSSPALAK